MKADLRRNLWAERFASDQYSYAKSTNCHIYNLELACIETFDGLECKDYSSCYYTVSFMWSRSFGLWALVVCSAPGGRQKEIKLVCNGYVMYLERFACLTWRYFSQPPGIEVLSL